LLQTPIIAAKQARKINATGDDSIVVTRYTRLPKTRVMQVLVNEQL